MSASNPQDESSPHNIEPSLTAATADQVSVDTVVAAGQGNKATPTYPPTRLVILGVLSEAGLFLVALISAKLFNLYDHAQPLSSLFAGPWLIPSLLGAIVAAPMLCCILSLERLRFPGFDSLRQTIDDLLAPLFSGLNIWQIAIISLAAGVGEEFLFRWCLQGGLYLWLTPATALLVASIVFGVCHWINAAYALMATIMGLLLGLMMMSFGLFMAISAHACYDFLAILYIVRFRGAARARNDD